MKLKWTPLEMFSVGLGYVVLPAVGMTLIASSRPLTVTCPETGDTASVKLDRKRAVLSLLYDARQKVTDCSRWPERANCGRRCERSI